MPKKTINNDDSIYVKLPKKLKEDFVEAVNKEGTGMNASIKVRILIKEYLDKQS